MKAKILPPEFFQDEANMLPDPDELDESLLTESPTFKTLKAAKERLSDEERAQVKAYPIWKATVRGKTWYVSNTHRCFQADSTLKAAIKSYVDVVEPSG